MNNNIQAALVEVARNFVQVMSVHVANQKLPQKIVSSTSVGSPQQSEGVGYIDVSIDLSESGAPMAGAFEYGSGIWRTRGTAARYPIVPKQGKFLKFEYGVGRNIPLDIPGLAAPEIDYEKGSDFAFFRSVMHPGVAPRPYIRPALAESVEFTKSKLGSMFTESVILRGTTVYTVRLR